VQKGLRAATKILRFKKRLINSYAFAAKRNRFSPVLQNLVNGNLSKGFVTTKEIIGINMRFFRILKIPITIVHKNVEFRELF